MTEEQTGFTLRREHMIAEFCAESDVGKSAIGHVLIDGDGNVSASNGVVMATVLRRGGEKPSRPMLIPRDVFEIAAGTSTRICVEPAAEGAGIVAHRGPWKATLPESSLRFPDPKSVLPTEPPLATVHVDAKYLAMIAEHALNAVNNETAVIEIVVRGPETPLVIRTREGGVRGPTVARYVLCVMVEPNE